MEFEMITRAVNNLEHSFFKHRVLLITIFGIFTVLMGFFAVQLKMDAGFEKQMPIGHEYIDTFEKYRTQLFGANRITFAVKARNGSIWTKEGLSKVYEVTQAVVYLPNVDSFGVQSMWTPNTYVTEITDEGFRSSPLISADVQPAQLTEAKIQKIHSLAVTGGFVGSLVARDDSSAIINAELREVSADGTRLDYIAYSQVLKDKILSKYEDKDFKIEIIGFAKQVGDIADGAVGVLKFCAIAVLLVALSVYWYCHSIRFTILPLACSLTSLVWQFGTLKLLGFGLDPLAVLVPFLVFAIGVSHGVQQINYIVREIANNKSTLDASKGSFSALLVPGVLALVTAFVSFITLIMIPIPMVRELAITASIGVGYKILTNLVMLPVAASFFNFSAEYADKVMLKREQRAQWLSVLSRVARPRNAVMVILLSTAIFAISAWESKDRVIGTLQPGAPELRADSRYNLDATDISSNYDGGLDWLTVVIEGPKDANLCSRVALGPFEDALSWKLESVPGVQSVSSFTSMLRTYSQGYNEGNPKMAVVPIDPTNYAALATELMRIRGYVNSDCSMTAIHAYLTDHKATTLNQVIKTVKEFRSSHHMSGVTIRLASGNAGVIAAINEEVEKSEIPMMLYVYASIAILVFLAYRDFRAVLACCMPLTGATFIGYWFMKELDIGLTVATLPVMVLAVGIGVDYSFYIYNRLQYHRAVGEPIQIALQNSIKEVGMATIFTAITLAAGVVIWSFSDLKFQADMGKLLAFMFIVNLVMAMTALPAIAVVLDIVFPQRSKVRLPGFVH
jgi:uncharacterized protein